MLDIQYDIMVTQYLLPNTKEQLFPKIGLRVGAAICERYTLFSNLYFCILANVYTKSCVSTLGPFYVVGKQWKSL